MTHTQIEEQDIVDRYLLKRLTPEVEAEFEEHYLGCRHCLNQLENSRETMQAVRGAGVEEVPARRLPGWLMPVPALGLAAAMAMAVIYVSVRRPAPAPVEPRASAPPAAARAPVIELQSYRSGQDRPATVRADAGFTLRLDLRGLAAYESYRVEIVGEAGEPAWRQDRVAASGPERLEVRVEPARLQPGAYWVRLTGAGAAGRAELLREYSLLVAP
jgi:hypothetical protein